MAIDSPRAEFFRRITRHALEQTEHNLDTRALYAPDGLAVAVALEPEIVLKAETHPVRIELAGQHTRGQMVVDWNDRTSQATSHAPCAVNLVLELDGERLWELMQAGCR